MKSGVRNKNYWQNVKLNVYKAKVSLLSIWHFCATYAIIWKSIIFPACLILTQQQLYLFFYYIQENLNAFNSLINSREIGRCSFCANVNHFFTLLGKMFFTP